MKLKFSILALSASTILGGAMIASDVKAGVFGSSILEISNFFIFNAAGDVPGGVRILQETRNGEMAVGLNGVQASNTGTTNVAGANLDLAPVWLGLNPLSNNSTAQLAAGAGTFSRSDLFVSGSVFGAGGQGLTRSDAYALSGGNQGNANSTIANNVFASYQIQVDEDMQARFVLDADVFLKAFVSEDLFGTGSNANASISFSIDVLDSLGSTVLSWSPGQLNRGVTAIGVAGFSNVGGFTNYNGLSSELVNIASGQYNVTIQQKATARQLAVNQVPEPSLVALFAIGLVGIGFAGCVSRRLMGSTT
jgi:hypothetical protein